MTFRPAEQKDLVEIISMLAQDQLGQTREQFSEPLAQAYLVAFENITKDSNQELIVLEDDQSEVIGTLQLSFLQYLTYRGGVRAQVEGVRIRKDKRGQGIGEVLFNWVIQRAKEKGAHLLQLTSDKKRADALRFYEKLGFVASHEGFKLHF